MKRNLFFLSVIIVTFITSCNNSGNNHDHQAGEPQTKADTLLKEVVEGHDVAMSAQMTKMDKAKQGIERLIDSVSKLPAKANGATTLFKEKLGSLLKDLNEADAAMNKWMDEFNYDSAKDNMEERVKYLTDEKLKVGKVKDAILNSVQKADSVLKKKF